MISNPRHGSPPRLMAHQPTRCSTTQESSIRVHRPEPVEEHFYAIYPLLLMALLSAHRRLAPVLIGLCGLALCLRIGVALAAPTIAPDYTGMATECRIDGILAGAIAALLGRSDASPVLVRRVVHPSVLAAALVLLLACFVIRDPLFRQTLRYTVQEIALIPIVLAAVNAPPRSWLRGLLDNAPMRAIGKLSYSLYLWHFAGFGIGLWMLPGAGRQPLAYAFGWGAAFAVAYASYRFVEQPFFRLRRRFGSHVESPGAYPWIGATLAKEDGADQPARSA